MDWRSFPINKKTSLYLLPSLGFLSSFLVAGAQVELRPQITGTAKTETSATAKLPIAIIVNEQVDMEISSGTAPPSKKMQAVHVKIHNRSDAPLIFDGDRSYISSQKGGQLIARCISQNQLDAVGRPPTTFKGKLSSDLKATVTAAVSVGIVQTAETMKREAGPIENRYEYDHARQKNEESRFGRRLVYPGDSTDGQIYFDSNVPLEDAVLELPIKLFYDSTTEATLGKPIRVTPAGKRQ